MVAILINKFILLLFMGAWNSQEGGRTFKGDNFLEFNFLRGNFLGCNFKGGGGNVQRTEISYGGLS